MFVCVSIPEFSAGYIVTGDGDFTGLAALYHGVPGRMRSLQGFFARIDEITWFIAASEIKAMGYFKF